jgi:hypothetical protein
LRSSRLRGDDTKDHVSTYMREMLKRKENESQ